MLATLSVRARACVRERLPQSSGGFADGAHLVIRAKPERNRDQTAAGFSPFFAAIAMTRTRAARIKVFFQR